MTRLDQNRATAQLAMKAGVKISAVKGVIIWGNHSSTQFPDAEHATIAGKRAAEVIQDADWLGAQFVPTVQKRGAAVIAARKLSSAMSAAVAACDHMASWWRGTAGDWVSMGVFSDGSYGTPAGVMFSFPVTIKDGQWAIVQVTTIYIYISTSYLHIYYPSHRGWSSPTSPRPSWPRPARSCVRRGRRPWPCAVSS